MKKQEIKHWDDSSPDTLYKFVGNLIKDDYKIILITPTWFEISPIGNKVTDAIIIVERHQSKERIL